MNLETRRYCLCDDWSKRFPPAVYDEDRYKNKYKIIFMR